MGGGGIIVIDTSFKIKLQKAIGPPAFYNNPEHVVKGLLLSDKFILLENIESFTKGNTDIYIYSVDTSGNTLCENYDMNLTLLDIDTATITVIDTGFVAGNTNTIVMDYPLQQGYPQLEMMDCDSFVSIKEFQVHSSQFTVQIQPNPASDEFTVEINLSATEKITIELYDIMGREIIPPFEGKGQKGEIFKHKFNVSGLCPGVYLVSVRGETLSQVLRMIKTESQW